MKKLVTSLLAVSMIATLSIGALEKPGTPDVDYETREVEQLLSEKTGVLKQKMAEWKEKAKRATGRALEKIRVKIKQYEDALETR